LFDVIGKAESGERDNGVKKASDSEQKITDSQSHNNSKVIRLSMSQGKDNAQENNTRVSLKRMSKL
jgi:hypothetical protein